MVFLKFYGHFAAAIGTCVLLWLPVALLSSGDSTGLLISLGLVSIGGVYAAIRMSFDLNSRLQSRILELERRLTPAETRAA